jgi:pimeloyl-ACP methyl ester carboxylesterase
MYPGDFNTTSEMVGFYTGIRDAGLQQAVEVVQWSLPAEPSWGNEEFWQKFPGWAEQEAGRIAEYEAAYPGAPVTLLGFSGGCMAAILVAEKMPQGSAVDAVIMLSPGVSPDYDLTKMLANVRQRAVVYWSRAESQFGRLLLQWAGTVDGNFGQAAGLSGFTGSYQKLVQIEWQPDMADLGNKGDHLDYFLAVPWIREYVASWVARPTDTP